MTRWLALALAALPAATAPAADPADDLLRLVPPDTAVCLVARDLRRHVARVAGSPFARWLAGSDLLDAGERAKLVGAERFMTDKLGVTPKQLLDDVFGDAVVLAYRPGPPGKPGDESGVLLVHARDPARLEAVGSKLDQLQTDSGELADSSMRTHAGRPYRVRSKAGGGSEYLHRSGNRFAFSGQEAAIRRVIDRMTGEATAVSPAAASLRRLGLADAPLVAWFHPPALAADLHAKRDSAADPTEKAVLSRAGEVWAACDGLAVFARADRGLQLGAAASVDTAKLPAEVRTLLFPAAGGSAWGAVPADALLAAGGRFDLPAVLKAAESFLPPAGRDALAAGLNNGLGPLVGRPNLPGVLAGVGPEWVAWADDPAEGWAPEWTVAVRLSGAARKPVLQALDFGVGLVRLGYNRDHADQIDLADDTRDGRTIKFLANPAGFAAGQRPAYGVKDGFLVLASSPERVHRFAVHTTAAEPPVLRLHTARLRDYLAKHREPLAAHFAAADKKAVADVRRELGELGSVLGAVNRVELRHTAGDGLIRLTLDVEPVEPLR